MLAFDGKVGKTLEKQKTRCERVFSLQRRNANACVCSVGQTVRCADRLAEMKLCQCIAHIRGVTLGNGLDVLCEHPFGAGHQLIGHARALLERAKTFHLDG